MEFTRPTVLNNGILLLSIVDDIFNGRRGPKDVTHRRYVCSDPFFSIALTTNFLCLRWEHCNLLTYTIMYYI